MDWPTAITEASKIVFPSLFTFLGSYLAIRSQLKTKSLEIESQTSLKAKELIFSAYQKRWEKAEKDSAELMRQAHEIFDKHMRKDYEGLVPLSSEVLLTQMFGLYQEDFDDLIAELKAAGIMDKHSKKIELVRSQLAVDIKSFLSKLNNPPQEKERKQILIYTQGLATASATISTLYGYLLQKKAEDLFSGHVKSGALTKRPQN